MALTPGHGLPLPPRLGVSFALQPFSFSLRMLLRLGRLLALALWPSLCAEEVSGLFLQLFSGVRVGGEMLALPAGGCPCPLVGMHWGQVLGQEQAREQMLGTQQVLVGGGGSSRSHCGSHLGPSGGLGPEQPHHQEGHRGRDEPRAAPPKVLTLGAGEGIQLQLPRLEQKPPPVPGFPHGPAVGSATLRAEEAPMVPRTAQHALLGAGRPHSQAVQLLLHHPRKASPPEVGKLGRDSHHACSRHTTRSHKGHYTRTATPERTHLMP